MPLISKVSRGQPITSEKMNSIIDALNEARLTSVVGGQFSRGLGGTTITVTPPRGQASSSQSCPFTPTAVAVTGGFDVSFSVGTINGILPSNMFTPLTGVTTSARNYFYIKCTSDGKSLESAIIEKDATIRTPPASTIDTAPTELDILIATMATSGSIVTTIACENLTATIIPTIQEDNTSFVVGERNFKQYYNWEV